MLSAAAGARGVGPGPGLALAHLYPPHAASAAAPPAAMTPEFLPPPPRPHARYPQRAPRPAPPADPPSAAPAFPPVPGAYARFLPHPHPAGYGAYPLYRPPAPAAPPQPERTFSPRPRAGPGFVPPAPAPPSPPPAPDPPSPPPAPPAPPDRHFCRGALIRLESGALRRVEDMRTEDFVSSAERCSEAALAHCTLLRLEERGAQLSLTLAYDTHRDYREQVELDAAPEQPFFVYGRGWASGAPERTRARYGLAVRRLRVGDVCVSLVARSRARAATPPPPAQLQPENLSVREDAAARKRRWSAPDHRAKR